MLHMRCSGLMLVLGLCALTCGTCASSTGSWQPKPPKPIDIVGFTATPNPATAGQPVTITAVIKTAEEKNELFASMYFGDSTPSVSFSGSTKWDALKAVSHTFTAAGVYAVTLFAETPRLSAQSTLYVVVGRGSVVNPISGVFVTATDVNGATRAGETAASRYAGGVTNVRVDDTGGYATDATTTFADLPGRAATVTGLQVSHTYTQKGIYVATSTALSGSATMVGKVRKMLNVSSRDAGDSGALANPASADIKITKIQGKLSFAKNTPDKLSFTGEITLPAGFVPIDGTEISVGVGNIVDTVVVDAKGKMTAQSAAKIITKLGIKYPKTGATTAKITVSVALPDMDVAGMDTEGITASVRTDEANLKAVSRRIQIDLLVTGVAYETSAAVQYKVSKPKKGATSSESGQFKGLPSRSGK